MAQEDVAVTEKCFSITTDTLGVAEKQENKQTAVKVSKIETLFSRTVKMQI